MALRTNEDRLVMIAVQGTVAPAYQWAPFEVDADGRPFAWPSTGGITYNVKLGDSAFGWAGEHIEPGVSTKLDHKNNKACAGYQFLPCVGNEARVISGEAKGAIGTVIGHHGGVEHLMLDFPDDVLEKLTCDDRFLIRAYGQGLRLLDHPDVHLFNLDPKVLRRWGWKERADGRIEVPVAAIVPGHLMGSGIGSLSVTTGDYDILCHDAEEVKKHGLDRLRLGDFVAIENHDGRFGRTWRRGAITIGIVIHTDSPLAGHGPGVTTLASALHGKLVPVIDPDANLGRLLGIGRFAEQKAS